jgi:hypothetical protein
VLDTKCRHGRKICSDCIVVDDAAKRAYDAVRELATFNDYDTRVKQSPWVALRLSDGESDGRLYDTKRDAVRHQLHEMLCAYFCFRNAPSGFATYRDAAIYLAWNRAAYDSGMRMPDPDARNGGRDLVLPTVGEHLDNQLRRLLMRGV